MSNWTLHNDEWKLQIGRIGCIVVDVERRSVGHINGWRVAWHEQSDYVYSEGVRLEPDNYLFPYTDEGLEQAKQAGIQFATILLNEAINSLNANDNPNP